MNIINSEHDASLLAQTLLERNTYTLQLKIQKCYVLGLLLKDLPKVFSI